MSFPFAEDISRDLTVGLQAVSASFLGTSHSLLPQGILTFIDSTVPTIWLPLAACQQFEKVFGLTCHRIVSGQRYITYHPIEQQCNVHVQPWKLCDWGLGAQHNTPLCKLRLVRQLAHSCKHHEVLSDSESRE
jgi:hypothetical protein